MLCTYININASFCKSNLGPCGLYTYNKFKIWTNIEAIDVWMIKRIPLSSILILWNTVCPLCDWYRGNNTKTTFTKRDFTYLYIFFIYTFRFRKFGDYLILFCKVCMCIIRFILILFSLFSLFSFRVLLVN